MSTAEPQPKVLTEREAFIEHVIKPTGVSERIVAAFTAVDRAQFMHEDHPERDWAYTDHIIRLSHDGKTTISQPSLVALMIELADVKEGDKVLEIGTASGYQAAVLSHLAKEVHTIEIDKQFRYIARINLNLAGCDNVTTHVGDGAVGLEADAPFNAMIITAGLKAIPPKLVKQLAVGGRIVVPIGEIPEDGRLKVYTKQEDGTLTEKDYGDAQFVPFYSPEPGAWNEDDLRLARQKRREDAEKERDARRAQLKEFFMQEGEDGYQQVLTEIGRAPQFIVGHRLSEGQILDLFDFYSSLFDRGKQSAEKPAEPSEEPKSPGHDAHPSDLMPEAAKSNNLKPS